MSPKVYIVGGPNGAGKTTFAREFLPNYADCRNFINVDLIAAGLSPLASENAAIRAGRIMLSEIDFYRERGADFGFETTLSGRGYLNVIKQLRHQGYKIHIFFVSVPNVALALSRIRKRVLRGGHDVPEADVRRRFDRSNRNFFNHYRPLADSWILYDNSEKPSAIAFENQGELHIIEPDTYNALIATYGHYDK